MGGCCAPGTLGAAARGATMVDGVSNSSQQIMSGDRSGDGSSCGDCGDFTGPVAAAAEQCLGAAAQEIGASEENFFTLDRGEAKALDVEKVLRVLEIAVEREYVDGLRDHSNVRQSQHQENIASLRSSLAESTTSLCSVARHIFWDNGSNSKSNISYGDREPCSARHGEAISKRNSGLYEGNERNCLSPSEKAEVALEPMMHYLENNGISLELKTSSARFVIEDHTLDNVDKIRHQVLPDDTQGKSTQARESSTSPSRQCQPETLIDCDDYPRGTSDTNSDDAERDKKTICNTPIMSSIYPSRQTTSASFISLGLVQCQPKESEPIPTHCLGEGSMTAQQSACTSDPIREVPHRVGETISSNIKVEQKHLVVDDSYASWLDRHSEELGWKNDSTYKSRTVNDQATWAQADWRIPRRIPNHGESDLAYSGITSLQRQVGNFFHVDNHASWRGPRGGPCSLPEFELRSEGNERQGERACVSVVKNGQTQSSKIVDDLETTCLTSRSQEPQEQTSKIESFELGEHVNGSFKFAPNFESDDYASHASMRSYQIPNPVYFDMKSNLEHQRDWTRIGLGRPTKPIGDRCLTPIQTTSPRYHVSEYGGTEIIQTPHLKLENLPKGSRGGLSCSQLNSRVDTPKSILSEGRSLATNVEYKEKVKVCVRMRPFLDHEKVCPLRQLLCVLGKKVVVKEYGGPTQRRSFDSNDTDLLVEFKVDCVLDDSYLQTFKVEQKEDSQRRMYESIGLPCLEYALDGYNTTVIAYGQVGTGKTYTMMGDGTEEGKGLMPRLAKDLMNHLNTDFKGEFEVQGCSISFDGFLKVGFNLVAPQVSYLEIYQEKIRDLLATQKLEVQDSKGGSMRSCAANFFDCFDESNYEHSVDCDTASNASFFEGTPRSWRTGRIPSVYFDTPAPKKDYLKVREHPVTGPYVEGLLWKTVTTWQDLETVMLRGAANRTLAAIPLNKLSSRGHTLFTIKLIRGRRKLVHGYPSPSFSLINLVDLAGTDKPQSAKKSSLERLEESRYINRSLAQLNDVILNLSRNKKFISYRSSALTWLLRDSLGGNSKLFLIASISPAEQDFQESVNTLRYASRANRIHSLVSSNPDPKKQLIVRMKKEIQVLHNLVHDLTKKKIAECESEELSRAQQNLPLRCRGPACTPTGVQHLTKNKIAECVSEELRRAQCLPVNGQGSDCGDQYLTKNKIAECVNEELRRAQQQHPLQCQRQELALKCQASEYESTGTYMETTDLPECIWRPQI